MTTQTADSGGACATTSSVPFSCHLCRVRVGPCHFNLVLEDKSRIKGPIRLRFHPEAVLGRDSSPTQRKQLFRHNPDIFICRAEQEKLSEPEQCPVTDRVEQPKRGRSPDKDGLAENRKRPKGDERSLFDRSASNIVEDQAVSNAGI